MTAEELWSEFEEKYKICDSEYSAWAFGGAPDELADLVLSGEKTGTASAYQLYELEDEPLPKEGEYSVILDSRDNAVCIIKTTRVYVVPFSEVTSEHAYKEGEGDKSLEYWREVHQEFFTGELESVGLEFSTDMLVVCEEFEVVMVRSIKTKDLILRKAVEEDWKEIYNNLWRHKESAKYMYWDVTTSEEDAIARMQRTITYQKTNKYAFFVYEKARGQAIGFAGMKEIEPGVFEDAGLAIGPDFVGKGYGTQILNALIEEAKGCGAHKFIASCRKANIASHKLQMSCGFTFVRDEDRTDLRNGESYILEINEKLL